MLNAGLDKNPVAKTEVGGYIKISYTGWGTHRIIFCLNTGLPQLLNGPPLFISSGGIANHTIFTTYFYKK
jgi:hypothetical protein